MSHQIPEYFRYVSAITIVNPGSGYTSIPTITMSGGGGSGATATATIFNGQIQAVNITNVGQDYTTAPTVTVTGGDGSNANLTAVLAFAAGTPTDYEEKSALGVKYTLPEFIQNDYNQFVTFIEKYYEYMDSDGNPINLLLNKRYIDIDDLNDAELNKRAMELAKNFPQILQTDRKSLLKKIKNIYESKGSERSIKAYFKLLYDEEVEVYYPSKNILRASDGIWIEETSVRATSGFNNYEVLALNSRVADIKYYETIGSVTLLRTIEITIPRVEKIAYTSPRAYEVVIELPAGVTDVPGPGSQATATATIVAGEITQIDVTFGGYGYTAAPIIVIYDTDTGAGADARAVVTDGEVTSIVVNDGGADYDSLTTDVTFNTESIRSFIVERGATSTEENIRAYLDRSLSSVASGAYSGASAGFSVGDVFAVNESGDDGTGYAISGYFAGDYTFTGGSNNAVIRVAAIDTIGVPTAWSIINPGEGFRNAQTVINIESKTGESLDITLFTKYLYSYDGKYKDDRGKLSDVNRIQDNYKYQSYSYIIKSTISQNQWVKRFRDLMHPAGMEVFGDLIITNNINFAPFIEITTDGLNLHVFKTEDIVSNDDSTEIVVQWFRDFTESQSAADVITSFAVEKSLSDISNTNDAPVINVGKAFNDSSSTSEIFSPAVHYARAFTDEILNSTDSIILALELNRTLADSTNNSDSLSILTEPNISDTASASDAYDQDEYAGPDALPINYVGSGVSKYLEKVFTDVPVVSELLERAVAFNRVFTDIGSVNEVFSFNMSADLGNQIVVTDDFTYDIFIAHILSDTVHIDDAGLFSLSIDSKFIEDDITPGEVVSINTEKGLVEVQTASESAVVTFQKPFTENGNIADSGIITIQDYSDPTYLSEDYVGAGYNF